jgi:NAD-dependent deacetylase
VSVANILPETVRAKFRAARRVLVLTGAGVSAESGVPTFRGGGAAAVWKGMPFDQISSARMVRENLSEVWEWFDYRRRLIGSCEPNPAHYALARWAARFPHFTLVTQNIDGLHQRAGSRDVWELHGNIWRARCETCGVCVDLTEALRPAACAACGGRLRPDVVLFGEMLPAEAWEKGAEAAQFCDLCLVAGTSALVYPAAALPEIAFRAGAYVIEVNPEETPCTMLCQTSVRGQAGEILPLFEAGEPQ